MTTKRTPLQALQSISLIKPDQTTGGTLGGMIAGGPIALLALEALKAGGDPGTIALSLLDLLSPCTNGKPHTVSERNLNGQLHAFLDALMSSITAPKDYSGSIEHLLGRVAEGRSLDEKAYLKMEHVELLRAA
jgi:hypothetical protein